MELLQIILLYGAFVGFNYITMYTSCWKLVNQLYKQGYYLDGREIKRFSQAASNELSKTRFRLIRFLPFGSLIFYKNLMEKNEAIMSQLITLGIAKERTVDIEEKDLFYKLFSIFNEKELHETNSYLLSLEKNLKFYQENGVGITQEVKDQLQVLLEQEKEKYQNNPAIQFRIERTLERINGMNSLHTENALGISAGEGTIVDIDGSSEVSELMTITRMLADLVLPTTEKNSTLILPNHNRDIITGNASSMNTFSTTKEKPLVVSADLTGSLFVGDCSVIRNLQLNVKNTDVLLTNIDRDVNYVIYKTPVKKIISLSSRKMVLEAQDLDLIVTTTDQEAEFVEEDGVKRLELKRGNHIIKFKNRNFQG